ncbi:hypothetical protein GQ607_005833 [Colletotrichum asianum]|uniref:Uncharacterized protein n=1 Tax=Colletotrichum asianum TaxID=702518 RepID=A0A8H3ZP00_9PEZI|nr:hypothetical protein GQ607_005833 [Colletotrichum asianum]
MLVVIEKGEASKVLSIGSSILEV